MQIIGNWCNLNYQEGNFWSVTKNVERNTACIILGRVVVCHDMYRIGCSYCVLYNLVNNDQHCNCKDDARLFSSCPLADQVTRFKQMDHILLNIAKLSSNWHIKQN